MSDANYPTPRRYVPHVAFIADVWLQYLRTRVHHPRVIVTAVDEAMARRKIQAHFSSECGPDFDEPEILIEFGTTIR